MKEPALVIADILQNELGLSDGQVMLGNQRREIPAEGLYIFVFDAEPGTPIGVTTEMVDVGGVQIERQTATIQHRIRIELMAFNDDQGGNQARQRKEEVILALSSFYSQNAQTENAMQIARNVGAFIDLSSLEGPAMLTRFAITVPVTALHLKEKPADYFDTFAFKETINV